jgi:hypothetical protein
MHTKTHIFKPYLKIFTLYLIPQTPNFFLPKHNPPTTHTNPTLSKNTTQKQRAKTPISLSCTFSVEAGISGIPFIVGL